MTKFSERLAALGFGSYADYLDSPHWNDFKSRYRASGRPTACAVCDAKPSQLHHHTYQRLGEELLEDVTPLCRGHHQAVHAWLKSTGKMVNATHRAVAVLKSGHKVKIPAPDEKRPPASAKAGARRRAKVARVLAQKAQQEAARTRKRQKHAAHAARAREAEPAKKQEAAQRQREFALALASFSPFVPPPQAPAAAVSEKDKAKATSEMRRRLEAIRASRK